MGDPDFFFPDEFPYDFTPLDSTHLLDANDSDDDDSKIDDTGCSPQSTLCSDSDWERSITVQHNRPLHLAKLKEEQQQRWRRNNKRQPMAVEYGRRAQFLSSGSSSSSSFQNKWMRESSPGTGVFLPRATAVASTETSSPTTRKKPACSKVLVPARVVQALNLNLEEIGAQPTFPGGGFILDIEAMKARTRTLQSQQKKKTNPNHRHLR